MKFINAIKNFWKDQRGSGGVFQTVGLVIGVLVLVAVVTSIGITTGKNKMKGVAGEITGYHIETPAEMSTAPGDSTFGTTSGDHTVTGISITN